MKDVKGYGWRKAINLQVLGNIIVPIIAVIFAMLIGSLFMISVGANPLEAYGVLLSSAFGSTRNIFETLVNTTPLIFTGLSVAFAFRCGLFNIGGEGQFFVAYVAAAWVGAFFSMPVWIHVPLALIAAMVAGGIWGGIPGYLKAKLGVHEVISTIMFNYIGLYFVNLLIRTVLTDPTGYLPATPKIAKSAQLFRFMRGSRLNLSIIIAAFAALLIYWILWKTTLGYEVRAVGLNPFAAEYGGISVARNIVLAMAISGALAGLAGASQVMGLELKAYQPFGFIGHGFTGIAVALLGKNHPAGILLGALLFGVLQRGANMMQSMAGVPKEVISIIQAIIIFFVASDYIVRKLYRNMKKEKVKKEVGE